jgi:hypothetical protein
MGKMRIAYVQSFNPEKNIEEGGHLEYNIINIS